MKRTVTFTFVLFFAFSTFAQRKVIEVGTIPGYQTLKCDFHMHTIFSDGLVWPDYRVDEAYRDGLDAIAITDHIEYLPHKKHTVSDHNTSFEIAKEYAASKNIILIPGTEITRKMPPGHLNALFLDDVNQLTDEDFLTVIEMAIAQDAFVFWNHPGWTGQQPDGVERWYDVHSTLLAKGWLHGIEFFNYSEHYPVVLDWCIDSNLTVICNSDVHGIISEQYDLHKGKMRPMTLVFAKERSAGSIREGLMEGRTLAYFNDTIAGKPDLAEPFFMNSIQIGEPFKETDEEVFFEIRNDTDIPYKLKRSEGQNGPGILDLEAHSSVIVRADKSGNRALAYEVLNMMVGMDKNLTVSISY